MADVKLSDRENPLYSDKLGLWSLYYEAAAGGQGFAQDNLFTHRLEDNDDFADRKDRVYYLNFCDTLPTIYNSYIFQNEISRKPDETLEEFRRNVDGKGTAIDDFVKKVGYYSSVYGVCHVIVDIPTSKKKGKISKLDAKRDNLYPFARILHPTQLKDWSIDEQGNFRWVLIEYEYYKDEDPTQEREIETHYKLITTENWEIVNQDGDPVKLEDGSPNKGPNTLGFIPIVTMYHKNSDEDDKVGESMLKDIVYINIIILNWCSLIDEQLARNCFSQLVIPDRGDIYEAVEGGKTNPLVTVGNSSVFTFDGESANPPQFISPNTDTITTVWKMVSDHIKEMYRLSGLLSGTSDLYAPTSGRASQFGFLSTNAALAEKSLSYQKFENKMSEVAYLQLGKSSEEYEQVHYPTTFDLSTLEEELDSHIKIMEMNFSALLNKTIQKDISRKVVPLAPTSVRDGIEKEIDAGDGVVTAKGTMEEATPVDDGSGNPNLQKLSNTFKTSDSLEKEVSQKRTQE